LSEKQDRAENSFDISFWHEPAKGKKSCDAIAEYCKLQNKQVHK